MQTKTAFISGYKGFLAQLVNCQLSAYPGISAPNETETDSYTQKSLSVKLNKYRSGLLGL